MHSMLNKLPFWKRFLIWCANMLPFVYLVYVISLFVAAGLFQHYEHAQGRTFHEAFWWANVTALTIGYGDIAPLTEGGRNMAMIFANFTIQILQPLIILGMTGLVFFDPNKYTHNEQEWNEKAIKAIADKLGITLDPAPHDFLGEDE
jgi:voltage-gated potassium channel